MKFLKDLFSKVSKEPSVIQPKGQKMFVDFAEHVVEHPEDYSRDTINEATNVLMDDFFKECNRPMG